MTKLECLKWRHAAFCWRLARDFDVRLWSTDQRQPTFWDHLRWMAAHIKGAERGALVICDEQGPIGVYTAKAYRDGYAAGISLLPRARGKGHALYVLRLARDAALTVQVPLYALIKPGNHLSRKSFERAGFWNSGTTADGMLLYRTGGVVAVLAGSMLQRAS